MKRPWSFSLWILILIFALSGLAACSNASQAADGNTAATPVVNAPSVPAAAQSSATSPLESAAAGTLSEIYQRVNPSVVHIQVVQHSTASDSSALPELPQIPGFPSIPFGQQQAPNSVVRGEGSGFVWDSAGHIVTNNHVVAGADKITVLFADGRSATATLVGSDPDSDLAVLQVDIPTEALHPVQMADSTQLQVGQLAIAIGNPFGQEGTMTVGIISALGRLLPVEGDDPTAPHFNIPDIIQTDAAINPGNSGGVLLNDRGEVVGVTSAIISPVRASSGIGFAIPSALVQKVAPVLITDGEYTHPYLGISGTDLTPELAQAMNLASDQRGVLVVEVPAGGPADQAGIRGSDRQVDIDGQQVMVGGDVITAADNRPIHSMDDLISDLSRTGQVGATYTLTVLRAGKEQQVAVTLGARPRTTETASQTTNPQNGRAWLGIVGVSVTPEIAGSMNLPADQSGILVNQVAQGSPADLAGLQGSFKPVTVNGQRFMVGGDIITAVNGASVTDLPALQARLAQAKAGDTLTLSVLRDGKSLDLTVTLAERP